MMLSVMATSRVCLLDFTILPNNPKAGPKKGIQNRKMITSGRSFLYFSPTFIQLNGFTLFNAISISKYSGLGESVYCDSPGNKKFGYCKVKVRMLTLFCFRNSVASRSLYVAKPPRKGCAGPTITMC